MSKYQLKVSLKYRQQHTPASSEGTSASFIFHIFELGKRSDYSLRYGLEDTGFQSPQEQEFFLLKKPSTAFELQPTFYSVIMRVIS
jgi:hypothetical protein